MPHLEFLYRIVAVMDPSPTAISIIPSVQSPDITRLILPIAGGTVRGPQINGEIVKDSGADWAQRIANSSKVRKLFNGIIICAIYILYHTENIPRPKYPPDFVICPGATQ